MLPGVKPSGGVAPPDLSFPGISDPPAAPLMPPRPGVPMPGMPCKGGMPGGGLPIDIGPKPGALPFGGGGAPTGKPAPPGVRIKLPLFPSNSGRNPGRSKIASSICLGGGPRGISLGGGGGLPGGGGGFLGGTDGTAGFFLSLCGCSGSRLDAVCFLMRLLLKSPPAKRRRISNFRNSTMVMTAERISSRITSTITSPITVE